MLRFSYRAREYMSEQEPHPFRQDRLLRKQAFDQSNERTCTVIYCQYRRCILAAKRVIGAILDCACKKSAVHVKQSLKV